MRNLLLTILLVWSSTAAFAGGGGGCYSPNVISQYFDQLANGTDDCGVNNLTANGTPAFATSAPYTFFGFVTFGPTTEVNFWSDTGGLVTAMKTNRAAYSIDCIFNATVFADGASANKVIVSFNGANFAIFGFAGGGGNQIRFYANGQESTSATTFALNTSYHVTWSWDGTTRRIWQAKAGGPEYAETLNNSTQSGSLDASVSSMNVGRWTGGNNYALPGQIGHLRFWKVALLAPPPVDWSTLIPKTKTRPRPRPRPLTSTSVPIPRR